ncbi:hypothetical protein M885DRAFT_544037 [Pelagophyceae sp. CCMP2097]|nr:hypothetical protein M885DRAFT_544037 [Pelagophyceae sp. CCMP2097]|mmetsp:Transcript_10463/g.34657  ORF Transcript_10463/g.34657 Transcript_10463/m.34657 type:complete len:172 (-) Transcript_10463:93-608(-)|eukprot:CAMPEP_0184116018 /NCGR_PEP_ID=MMETSP0974-20121125/20219_1 /TAXON_ID=483370 /ORGANISM="non described non described, Strain CCMP2097" /LENGTH=171 /DNA_ID=CAMNT_0026419139 /DNA_START=266 /DNA_END=781 /DNA_ORIENTATION=+
MSERISEIQLFREDVDIDIEEHDDEITVQERLSARTGRLRSAGSSQDFDVTDASRFESARDSLDGNDGNDYDVPKGWNLVWSNDSKDGKRPMTYDEIVRSTSPRTSPSKPAGESRYGDYTKNEDDSDPVSPIKGRDRSNAPGVLLCGAGGAGLEVAMSDNDPENPAFCGAI